MDQHQDKIRRVFQERAATYTTSASHTDVDSLNRLLRCARPEPQWRALDVATGTGHTAFFLAPHVAQVTGVDLTPAMLDEARTLQAANGIANVDFRVADVHVLPFADAAFDLVTARRAPHHFADIRGALVEMRRVLRPGGRLVIDDRSVPEDDEVDALMNRLDLLHDESHVRQYRASEWRELLESAGLDVESLECSTYLRPISQMKRDVAPGPAAEIDRIMAGLSERQRRVMQVTEGSGELRHLHFFVLIAATRS